jgi:protein O-mannosyl-transferase
LMWYLKADDSFMTAGTGPSAGCKSSASIWNRWYGLSLFAFTLAMLSKGSVAILPLVLLLMVWWRRGRITTGDVWRAALFFAVAIVLTGVNLWFQTHGTGNIIRNVTPLQRLAGAGGVMWFYLSKAIFPWPLIFVYPQWNIEVANPLWWLALAMAVGVSGLLLYACWFRPSWKWARHLLFAWGFFGLALLPVLGFVDVGFMKYSLVADHYQYIAIIAVVTIFAAALSSAQNYVSKLTSISLKLCGAAIVAVLAALTWQQSQLYADSITLDQATLEQNPGCWLMHSNLAIDLTNINQLDEAVEHAQAALVLKPNYAGAHDALAVALAKQGKTDEAIGQFRQALALNQNSADVFCDFGAILEAKGQMPEAIENLQRAVQQQPEMFQAHWYLARALAKTGRLQESLEHLQIAAELHPEFVEAQINMGHVLDALGHFPEALAHYTEALRLQPNFPEAYLGQAAVYSEMNRSADAITAAQKGLSLAQKNGQTALAEQIEAWLTDYRVQSANSRP